MARRPIAAPGRVQRLLWTDIRRLKAFTVPELCALDRSRYSAAYEYLEALTAAGIVRKFDALGKFVPYRFELARDMGIEAPRLRRDGTPIVFGMAREQMWRSIRILREFSPRELAVTATTPTATVSEANAARYLLHLRRAGYLAVTRPAEKGRLPRYRLLRDRNTGPNPPIVQANGNLYDPNLGRVVWERPPALPESSDG